MGWHSQQTRSQLPTIIRTQLNRVFLLSEAQRTVAPQLDANATVVTIHPHATRHLLLSTQRPGSLDADHHQAILTMSTHRHHHHHQKQKPIKHLIHNKKTLKHEAPLTIPHPLSTPRPPCPTGYRRVPPPAGRPPLPPPPEQPSDTQAARHHSQGK